MRTQWGHGFEREEREGAQGRRPHVWRCRSVVNELHGLLILVIFGLALFLLLLLLIRLVVLLITKEAGGKERTVVRRLHL